MNVGKRLKEPRGTELYRTGDDPAVTGGAAEGLNISACPRDERESSRDTDGWCPVRIPTSGCGRDRLQRTYTGQYGRVGPPEGDSRVPRKRS